MPLYEYKCTKCDQEFELLRRYSEADEDTACPNCGGQNTERKISAATCNSSAAGYGTISPAACTNFT